MSNSLHPEDDRLLQRLVDGVPSMLASWDTDLRCRFANRHYEWWFGVERGSLIGTRLIELIGAQAYALHEPHVRAVLTGERRSFERIAQGPDGADRHGWVEYIPDVIDGRVVGFFVQVTDITEQRRRSDELLREQALREEVERQVRAADRLLHERGDMLNILAHEVRQPLNNASASLQSAASILNDFGERVASRRLMRAQVVLGEVLASIDNTLAAASLLARDDPIELEINEIDTLLDIAVADLLTGDRGRVRIENPCGTRSTLMDLGLMRLAMRNLLSNALKFSGDDTPVVLRVSESEQPPAMHIDVVDCGTGIAPDRVHRLFERLPQDDPGRASLGRSAPLGLYIVRRVLELHGGRVELAANGPEGVTMRLVLPEPRDD